MAHKTVVQLASVSNQPYKKHNTEVLTINTLLDNSSAPFTGHIDDTIAKNTTNHFTYSLVPYPDMLLVL